jgi:hypothetical protein
VPVSAPITDTSGLAAALRTLKLSGMRDTLQARLAQARAGELGHLEFLQVLCEDEISRRAGAAIGRRLRRARLEDRPPSRASTSPPAPASPPPPSATWPRCAGWTPANQSSCPGRSASARHFIACALGHQAIRAGHEVRFAKTSRILADLAGGRADQTWDKRLKIRKRSAHAEALGVWQTQPDPARRR